MQVNKEQKQVQQTFLNNEKEVLEKLKQNYQDALDEINGKIEMLMARQDADMQHVIYQVEYQKALKTQVQAILQQLQTNEFETVSEYLAKCYEDGFIGAMYDMQGQGVPLVLPLDQEAIVDAIQHETNLSTDLYAAFDIKDLQKKIAGEISRGLSTGQMFSEISRNIAGYARISRNNAMWIARTEGHRIQCKAAMNACNKAKSKGADVVKQWDSTLDGKTRSSHRRIDGEIRELDEPFSNGLDYPGDPKGKASEVINCRCALLQRARWAVGNDMTKWDEEEGIVEIKAKDYNDFKNKYNNELQRVRRSTQKIKSQETLEKTVKSSTIKSTIVKDAIDSGTVSKTINIDKQKRHLKDNDDYIEGRSYIKGDVEDAQKLVDELSGTGTPIIDSKGKWTNKERVESSETIGVHINPDDNKETETKKATIVYSKTGSHIMPRKDG